MAAEEKCLLIMSSRGAGWPRGRLGEERLQSRRGGSVSRLPFYEAFIASCENV